MDNGDELIRVNVAITDLTTDEYIADGEPTPDYIPHTLPNEAIDEAVIKPILLQSSITNVVIKTNIDTPLYGVDKPVDISSLPIQDEIEEAQDKNIVGYAYRGVE